MLSQSKQLSVRSQRQKFTATRFQRGVRLARTNAAATDAASISGERGVMREKAHAPIQNTHLDSLLWLQHFQQLRQLQWRATGPLSLQARTGS